MKELITEQEQAKLLHCSARHVWNLRKRRLIPVIKLGRSVRYDPEAVARAMGKLTVKELG